MKRALIVFLFLSLTVVFASKIQSEDQETTVIVIDPGHGGFDGGAVNGNVCEKDLALAISIKISDLFTSAGFAVFMTRSSDDDLAKTKEHRKRSDIEERVKCVNDNETTLFLSIHLNAFPMKSLRGAQVFYSKRNDKNKELAEELQSTIALLLQNTKRQAKSIDNIYLLENATKTGCLIEVGFLSNEDEKLLLVNDSYQDKIAFAIYAGTLSFLIKQGEQ